MPVRACDHPAADLLFSHARGKSSPDERRVVEEHLAICDTCGRRVELIAWIRRSSETWGAALFEEHVPSGTLVAFCETPEGLTPDQASSVRTHLEICRSCSSEVATLRQVSDALAGAPTDARRKGRKARWTSWRGSLSSFLRPLSGVSPVPAYVLVLVLLLPASSGVRHWLDRERETAVPEALPFRTVTSPVFLGSGTERGDAEPTPVITAAESEEITLILQAPIVEGGAFRYDAELLGPAGESLWEQEGVQSIDQFGTIVLFISARELSPGRYAVQLHEMDAEGREDLQTFLYRFRVGGGR